MNDKLLRYAAIGGTVAASAGAIAVLKWLEDHPEYREALTPPDEHADGTVFDTPDPIEVDIDPVTDHEFEVDEMTVEDLLESLSAASGHWETELITELETRLADDRERVLDQVDALVALVTTGDYPDDLRETAADCLAATADEYPQQFSETDISRVFDALGVDDPELRADIRTALDAVIGAMNDPEMRDKFVARYQAALSTDAVGDTVTISGTEDEEASDDVDQCVALTQSGDRCSRDASDDDRYCSQHRRIVDENGADAVTDYDESDE